MTEEVLPGIFETVPLIQLTAALKPDEPKEGPSRRWLFVDQRGRIKSATAQVLASRKDINARAVGSDVRQSLIPITLPLIYWAERIIFMDDASYQQAQNLLTKNALDTAQLIAKSTVLNIPDEFVYMEYGLQETIKQQLPELQTE